MQHDLTCKCDGRGIVPGPIGGRAVKCDGVMRAKVPERPPQEDMMLYVSKPQTVEAVQWTGDNYREVHDFGASVALHGPPAGTQELRVEAGKNGAQGYVAVPVGHWIVRQPGDLTHHWPVDPDYFADKYDPAP